MVRGEKEIVSGYLCLGMISDGYLYVSFEINVRSFQVDFANLGVG